MIVKQTTGPPKGFLGKLLGFTWANKVFTLGQVWLKQEKDVSVKVTNIHSSHHYHYYYIYALMMRSERIFRSQTQKQSTEDLHVARLSFVLALLFL